MGLLKSVLSIGGAAVGNAILPGVGGKIGAALGGAAGGALSSSKGSAKATKAQLEAIREARGIAGEAKTEAIGYQQPYMDFGKGSVNALSGRLGVGMPQAVQPTRNALTTGSAGGFVASPELQAAAQADASGRPMMASKATGGPAGTSPVEPDWSQGPQGDTFAQPTSDVSRAATAPAVAGPAPGVDPGTYGDPTNPTAPTRYQSPEAPEAFSFDVQQFQDSPILQAALKRGSQEVQSSAAAGGHLQSGATLKDLQDRAIETSYRFYDNERNAQRVMARDERADFATDRGFDYGLTRDDRSDYERDRGYLTDRFDTQTDALFRGVGVGQGAAGVASSAATRYGDQVVGLVTDAGQAKAQNALTQGQIGSDFATGAGGIIAGAVGNGAPKNALTIPSGNVPFVNTPASISRNITYY